MRKLPDWLQQDEALAASSKSHQYLQMNINSLRRLLGKMKQTTPAFKAKSSSWMRLVYFVCLAILITLSHSTIQLWILAIFLLAHIAFLPAERGFGFYVHSVASKRHGLVDFFCVVFR